MSRGWLPICAAAALMGCAEERQSDDRTLSGPLPQANALKADNCPEWQLSCGKQKPVISDGITRLVNEDMGISALFSAGSRVCMARSGDAARGYYADYGFKDGTCSESSPLAEASIGIGSSYAPIDGPPLLLQSMDCKPPSAMLSQFSAWADDHFTAIPGSESLMCEDSDISGEVAITAHVYTPARIKGRSGTLYWASLRTREHRIREDLVRFRQFLRNLKLTGSQ